MKWKKSKPILFKEAAHNVDEEKGIIKDIVIIQEFIGEDRDAYGDNFDIVSLEQFVEKGNAHPTGIKSRFGHPNMCATTLGTEIGRFSNFRISKNADSKNVVIADLTLIPSCKISPNGNLYDYILSMSKSEHDLFGNSVVYLPTDSEVKLEKDGEGNDIENHYTRIQEFIASDLVDSPAATSNLFKDTTSNDLGMLVGDFLDDHPEVIEVLKQDPSIINNFIVRYQKTDNKTTTEKMKKNEKKPVAAKAKTVAAKLKEDIQNLLNEDSEKSFDAPTKGGTSVTISDDNGDGVASVGDMVTDSESGDPVASATIELADGASFTTDADGKITEVTAATEDTNLPEAAEKQINDLQTAIKAKDKTIKELEEKVETMEAEVADVQKEFAKLKENLAKTHGTFKPKAGAETFEKNDKPSEERDLKKEKAERRKKYNSSNPDKK